MTMIDPSATARSLARELVGTWELVSRIDLTTTGERRPEPSLGEQPIALLYYDRSGHFAAQFMKRDRIMSGVREADAAGAGAGAPNKPATTPTSAPTRWTTREARSRSGCSARCQPRTSARY